MLRVLQGISKQLQQLYNVPAILTHLARSHSSSARQQLSKLGGPMSNFKHVLSLYLSAGAAGVVLIATSISVYAQTSKLDAPISTKPTIRSEIKRGEAAAFDCGLKAVTNYLAFSVCVSGVADSNQQQSTKSDPFVLGLSIEALAQARIIGRGQDSGWESIWRKDTMRIIKSYKLTDADLCASFDMKCEIVKQIVSEAR
jgi:hypothetical protein